MMFKGSSKSADFYFVRGGMAGSIATIAILWVFFQTGQLFGQSQNNNRAFELPHRSHSYFHDGGSLQLRPATGDESSSSPPGNTFAHAKRRVLKSMVEGLNDSLDFSKFRLSLQRRLESNLVGAEIAPQPVDRPTTSDEALDKNYNSLVAIGASMQLTRAHCTSYGLSPAECSRHVSTMRLDRTSLAGQLCPGGQHILCDPSAEYRSIDGSCNNLDNPHWGSAFTAYNRILLPEYTDGIQSPKKEFGVHALPNARLVSATLSSRRRTGRQEAADKTLAFVQWSRFVSHDLSFTPTRKMVWTKAPIRCCQPDGRWPAPRYLHPDCLAIRVADDDADYSRHRIGCLDYARSMTVLGSDCSLGPAEQMNQASHFLDASNVYGSSQADSRRIRSFEAGQLRVARRNDRDYVPRTKDDHDSYVSGDQRINGDVRAAAMQTLWLREHNRVARALAKLNPHWSDETIYQEARRIVVAQIQRVTYHEWLPLLIGKRYYARAIADSSPTRNRSDDASYSENSQPGVYNEVATSALSFAHYLGQAGLSLLPEDDDDDDAQKSNRSLELAAGFHEPRSLEDAETLDGLVRGFARRSSRKLDLGSLVYKTNESAAGLDRLSFDIQRGRDHGLADYNDYRQLCGLRQAKSFDDFLDHVPGESVELLRKLYEQPGDVDLVVGGLAERSIEDAAIGPTFRCLVAAQFLRTRSADRFFYDSTRQPKPFTTNQMDELKKATLARIFCDNGDNIARMQSNVFLKPQVGNELQSCQNFDAIERIDLTKWIENIAY